MKSRNVLLFISLFLVEGAALCQGGEISRTLISEEAVPVIIKEGSVKCRNATHPPSFQTDGHIYIGSNNIVDRTLRVSSGLGVKLPSTLTCAEIQNDLAKVPTSLNGVRKVYKVYKESWDSQIVSSLLVAESEFEIPVQFEGKNIILKSEDTWAEDFARKSDSGILYQPLPRSNAYSVVTHPQAGSADTGLHCSRSPNTLEPQLTLWIPSRNIDPFSNITQVSRNFRSKEDCDDYRSETLKRFIAEDPSNNGSLIKINRKIESSFRYMYDNQANDVCQEIQVESINTRVGALTFSAVQVFPVRMVDFENCRK